MCVSDITMNSEVIHEEEVVDSPCGHPSQEEDRTAADTINEINNRDQQNGALSPGAESSQSACATDNQSEHIIYTEYKKSPKESSREENHEGKEIERGRENGGESNNTVLSVLNDYPNFLSRSDVCDLRVLNTESSNVMSRQYLEDRRDSHSDEMILTQNSGEFPLRLRDNPPQFNNIFPHLAKNFNNQDEQMYPPFTFTLQGNYGQNEGKVEEIDEVITTLKREDNSNHEENDRYEDILELGEKVRRYDDSMVRRNQLDVCSNASGRSSEIDRPSPPLTDRILEYGQDNKGELLDLHLHSREQQIMPNNNFEHLSAALHSTSSTPSPLNQHHEDGDIYTPNSSEGLHRLHSSSNLAALNQQNYHHGHHHSVHDVIQHSGNFTR